MGTDRPRALDVVVPPPDGGSNDPAVAPAEGRGTGGAVARAEGMGTGGPVAPVDGVGTGGAVAPADGVGNGALIAPADGVGNGGPIAPAKGGSSLGAVGPPVGPSNDTDTAPDTSVARGSGSPIGRRVVLGMLGLGAAGVLVGGRVQDAINALVNPLQAADPTGLTQLIPAAGGFRIYTITGSLPFESTTNYRLQIDGMVDRPLTLTLDDLKSRPPTSMVKDFQCVTGWRVRSVHWTGVMLATLLDEAGVQPGGTALRFESFDHEYTESLTMAQARRTDVLVAYDMLGAPVTRQHGGPVRMIVAPMYGYKSCKWLSRIVVVPRVEPGYWERQGYDVDGWVGRSNGRSDKATS